jgi:hypothetical protein
MQANGFILRRVGDQIKYPYWLPVMATLIGLHGIDWLYLQDWDDWTVVISLN